MTKKYPNPFWRVNNWLDLKSPTRSSHAWVKAVNMTHARSLFKKDQLFALLITCVYVHGCHIHERGDFFFYGWNILSRTFLYASYIEDIKKQA